MSRRLTKEEKRQLLEKSDEELESLCNHFIDSRDGVEFHEGMASGILVAIEAIAAQGGLDTTTVTTLSAIIARCIKETQRPA